MSPQDSFLDRLVRAYSTLINGISARWKEGRKPPRQHTGGRLVRTAKAVWHSSFFRFSMGVVASIAIFALLSVLYYAASIDKEVREKFEGKRWDIPAQAFARALELYPAKEIQLEDIVFELKLLGYTETDTIARSGKFKRHKHGLEMKTREFLFWDGKEKSRHLMLYFDEHNSTIQRITEGGFDVYLARLDPLPIGSFYPGKAEDRLLVKLEDLPEIIPNTLIAVEDRRFRSHMGVNPFAILRAMIVNIRAGKTIQGGSTITQQLAKNFFLNNEKSLIRKFREAVTAILLEAHFSKDQILETYLNEVYLAQNGSREIHGITMASMFYFGLHPKDLNTAQVATLIGLLKGPSKYNPRRSPDDAKERRNLVLDLLVEQDVITPEIAKVEKMRPLGVKQIPDHASNNTPYPDFMGLVKKQILRDYKPSDLKTEGIRVFTTLDPIIQHKVEESVTATMPTLDKAANFNPGVLKPAVITTQLDTGEVTAVIGSLKFREAGFNRAISAKRNIGSLIKPLIYMTALECPSRYNLATRIKDQKIKIVYRNVSWRPKNYDRREHGKPLLVEALAKSYNLAAARLGAVDNKGRGIKRIIHKLRQFGFGGKIRDYPSLLLGAVEMSLDEVSQIYLTLANKGFKIPLRSIRSVTDKIGNKMNQYTTEVEQVMDEKTAFLTYYAMREVVNSGTARAINKVFDPSYNIAGKTGTTNNNRDSWFAGFGGNYLTVAWIGRDNNRTTRLTGGEGALPLWIDVMQQLSLTPYEFKTPKGIHFRWVHRKTGKLSNEDCRYAVKLPFIRGTAPLSRSSCYPKPKAKPKPQMNNDSYGMDALITPPPRTPKPAKTAKKREKKPSLFSKWNAKKQKSKPQSQPRRQSPPRPKAPTPAPKKDNFNDEYNLIF
jgi:penicillin-binding protein 1B